MPGWCRSQYLIPRHLTFAREVRRQLVGTCDSAGSQVDICRPCHSTAFQLIGIIYKSESKLKLNFNRKGNSFPKNIREFDSSANQSIRIKINSKPGPTSLVLSLKFQLHCEIANSPNGCVSPDPDPHLYRYMRIRIRTAFFNADPCGSGSETLDFQQTNATCSMSGVQISSSRDPDTLRRALARGLFMNVAQLTVEGHYVALDSGQHVHLHPSSVLFRQALQAWFL